MADKLFTPEQTAEITEIVNGALTEASNQIKTLADNLDKTKTAVENLNTNIGMLNEENEELKKQIGKLEAIDRTIVPNAAPEAPKTTDVKPVIPTGTYKAKVKDGEDEKEVVVKFVKPGPFYMAEAKRQVTSEELAKPKNAALLAILVANNSNIIEVVG